MTTLPAMGSPEYRRLLHRWQALRGKPWTNKGEKAEIVELSTELDAIELRHRQGYSEDERALLANAGATI